MSLTDALFATTCIACRRPGRLCCGQCAAELAGRAVLGWPQPVPPGLPPPFTVAAYDGPCRDLLIAYKERGAVGLRPVLARPLAAAVLAAARASTLMDSGGAPERRLILVPVPSSRRATRIRGEDVVLALARRAAPMARLAGLSTTVVAALEHARRVNDSAGLGAAARATNLAGAFGVRRRALATIAGSRVIVVDDLMTTGASVAEASRSLRAAGAEVVGAATIASTRRRDMAEVLGRNSDRSTVPVRPMRDAHRADRSVAEWTS